jgi:RNA polymerase sigma-70 factor (ECF subfamily)
MADEAERELAGLIRAGAFDRAATQALDRYGPELYGFLVHYLGNDADASEVFSQVSEDLWTALPTFGLRCSVRTWLYVLAHHASARFRRSPWNRRGRRTGASHLEDLVARTRSRTQPWLRTEIKDRWRALRESLAPEERSLLVLRIDRSLPWEDIARITLGKESPDDGALARETARLCKRFQLLKEKLRRRAREARLIDDE